MIETWKITNETSNTRREATQRDTTMSPRPRLRLRSPSPILFPSTASGFDDRGSTYLARLGPVSRADCSNCPAIRVTCRSVRYSESVQRPSGFTSRGGLGMYIVRCSGCSLQHEVF